MRTPDMPDLDSYSFDIGPIRPPSEAYSLLIRATRNCPWNRCEFCAVYKGRRFQLRMIEDIKADIETARAISDEIRKLAEREGYMGGVREAAAVVYNDPHYNESVRSVALWLYFGAESAFLQDANSLIMRTPELLNVLSFLKESLPSLSRITSYGRSKTAAKKSIEEMKGIHDAGLSRLHLGLETGCDELLAYTQKGVTAEEQIRGGINVREGGISLSEYVMPGLGGKKWSREHAEQTARVLNEINPDYIRLRTTRIREGMPLLQKIHDGEFELQTEDEVVEEIGIFVEALNCRSELKSDHIINLLPEIEGTLPQDKEEILAVINRYLALPPNERLNYQLGRRAGLYERLDELYDALKHENIEQAIKRIEAESPGGVTEAIENLKSRMM